MAAMHPAFPPENSRIECFLPMAEGQRAIAIISCGDANFVFRADTPLLARRNAKAWLESFWADRKAGKRKRQPKNKVAPADLTSAIPPDGVSAAPAPSESDHASDGAFSIIKDDVEGQA